MTVVTDETLQDTVPVAPNTFGIDPALAIQDALNKKSAYLTTSDFEADESDTPTNCCRTTAWAYPCTMYWNAKTAK